MKTRQFFTDHMHLNDEGAALYVDAIVLEKTDLLPEKMRQHVEGCEPCQRRIIELRDLMKEMGYTPALPHPYFSSTVRMHSIPPVVYRIAAVIAVAGLLAAGYYTLVHVSSAPSGLTQTTMPEQTPTIPADTEKIIPVPVPRQQEPLLAENFVESDHLEDLVHTEFRSETAEVLSPLNDAVVQPPILFRWKHMEGTITLKILSNKERTLFSKKVSGDSCLVTMKFANGLYYWKLESEKELLFAGKFLVR